MTSKHSFECGPNNSAEKVSLKISIFGIEVRRANIRPNTLTHCAVTLGESML